MNAEEIVASRLEECRWYDEPDDPHGRPLSRASAGEIAEQTLHVLTEPESRAALLEFLVDAGILRTTGYHTFGIPRRTVHLYVFKENP